MTTFMTTKEVAERLDLTPRQVARLVESGELRPTQKLAGPRGAYIFDPANVEALADELLAEARERVRKLESGAAS